MAKAGANPLTWVSDRDVDLLLCAELHGSPPFADLVLQAAGLPEARFRGASLAAAEPRPELVIEAETPEGDPVAVIVDHRQGGLGRSAAAAEGTWTRAYSLYMAPDASVSQTPGADKVLTYENVIGWLAESDDGHGRFLAEVLRAAVHARASQASGSPADEPVGAFWQAYWDLASRRNPALRMKQPQGVPSGRTWPWFAEADGLRRGVALVHKTDRGAVDLTFASTPIESLRQAALPLLRPGILIHQARKQAVLRVEVPIVNMRRPFGPQQDAVEAALDAAEQLRQLFVANAQALDVVPLI